MLVNHRRINILVMLALMVGVLLPVATPHAAYAQDEEFGYYWTLEFDFEQSFNALLTIEVGPWVGGEMTKVTDTSTATVRCEPVGDVILDGGDAVFNGTGYLTCDWDLAALVLQNHNLEIDEVDVYGSIVARTHLMSFDNFDYNVAPIFTHQNGTYSLDFSQSSSVTMSEELWNDAGLLHATFPGVMGNSWNTYTYLYSCNVAGDHCNAHFAAGGQSQTFLDVGVKTQWSTGPNSFMVGSDGAKFFSGRMSHLIVDPGNSAH